MKESRKAIRGFLIFIAAFSIWWNKQDIYQFINELTSPSSVEWKEYTINLSSDYQIIRNTNTSLRMVRRKNESASVEIFEYDTKPPPPEKSVASICKLKECFATENGVTEAMGLNARTAKGKYNKNGGVWIVEFMSLLDTNIEIKIETSQTYYNELRSIITNIHKPAKARSASSSKN